MVVTRSHPPPRLFSLGDPINLLYDLIEVKKNSALYSKIVTKILMCFKILTPTPNLISNFGTHKNVDDNFYVYIYIEYIFAMKLNY